VAKKRLFLTFAALVIFASTVGALLALSACDDAPERIFQNADYRYGVRAGEVSIKAYVSDAVAAIIPSEIDGRPVTSIADRAFAQSAIVSVVVPSSVRSIGDEVFAECGALETATFERGKDTLSLGEGLFYKASALYRADLSARSFESLPKYAFKDAFNSAATDAKPAAALLPEGLKSIEEAAFESSNLTSLNLPETLETIGKRAFAGASFVRSQLIKTENGDYLPTDGENESDKRAFTFPDGLRAIGEQAFYQARGIYLFNMSDSIEEIGGGAFAGCWAATNLLVFSSDNERFTYVGKYYSLMSKDKTLYICRTSSSLSETFFSGADFIAVERIAPYAFASISVTSLDIPENIKKIGDGAFATGTTFRFTGVAPNCEFSATAFPAKATIAVRAGGTARQNAERYANEREWRITGVQ
jgi:hypothetical protein